MSVLRNHTHHTLIAPRNRSDPLCKVWTAKGVGVASQRTFARRFGDSLGAVCCRAVFGDAPRRTPVRSEAATCAVSAIPADSDPSRLPDPARGVAEPTGVRVFGRAGGSVRMGVPKSFSRVADVGGGTWTRQIRLGERASFSSEGSLWAP